MIYNQEYFLFDYFVISKDLIITFIVSLLLMLTITMIYFVLSNRPSAHYDGRLKIIRRLAISSMMLALIIPFIIYNSSHDRLNIFTKVIKTTDSAIILKNGETITSENIRNRNGFKTNVHELKDGDDVSYEKFRDGTIKIVSYERTTDNKKEPSE